MQFVPFLVEQPLLAVTIALTVVIYVGFLVALAYWARAEAGARSGSVLSTFLFLHVGYGLVYYVWVRYVQNDWESRTEPADRREQLATAYSIAVLLALVVGAVVTPPDPFTQVLVLPPLFVLSFVVSYLFVTERSVSGERAA